MDTERFDRIARAAAEQHPRRGVLRALLGGALGTAGLAIFGARADAKRHHHHHHGGGGGGGGGGGTPRDRCSGPVGICNADPTPCGTTATGAVCGCERAVEGNNVCINSGADNVCDNAVECTSTAGSEATSCRSQVGFHFFCQEAKTNAQGQFCGCGFGTATGRVCVPECDNP